MAFQNLGNIGFGKFLESLMQYELPPPLNMISISMIREPQAVLSSSVMNLGGPFGRSPFEVPPFSFLSRLLRLPGREPRRVRLRERLLPRAPAKPDPKDGNSHVKIWYCILNIR